MESRSERLGTIKFQRGISAMMNRVAMGLAITVFAGAASGQMAGIGRVGVLGGVYDSELDVPGVVNEGSTEPTFGVLAGYTVAFESFFADIGLEYQTITGDGDNSADFDRTDVLVSVGAFLPRDFNASVGYRFGYQGDGAFDDGFYEETGPFVGVGFPSFGLGSNWTVSTSAAVNFTELDLGGGAKADFIGFSGRAAMSMKGSPHSFGLRIQRFSDDEQGFDLTETYAHLFYQFSFLGMGG